MDCVVTAGPTFEPLDQVRRLTNFSTGKLGTELAGYLSDHGHRVTLLLGQQATFKPVRQVARVKIFTSTEDLSSKLQELSASGTDAILHTAAVSDFRFGKLWRRTIAGAVEELTAGKISTRVGPLLAELLPTTKIISTLRDWFPKAFLVGWKYEVDGGPIEVIDAAQRQLSECRTNACVANGPAYGSGFGVVRPGISEVLHVSNAQQLYQELSRLVETANGNA